MYTDEELKDTAVNVLRKLEQKFSFECAEVYIQSLYHMMGGTEYRTPKVFQSTNRAGCAIRFFKNNELFFACFPLPTVLNEIENLLSITSYPISTKAFDFPEISLGSSRIENIYDRRIASMHEEEIFNLSYSLNQADESFKEIILDGSIMLSLERKAIANSSQAVAFEKSTWFDIDVRALYRGFDMISSSEKHLTSRQIPNSIHSIVDDLISETIQKTVHADKLENVTVPVVFSPMAFSQIFSFSIVPLLRGSSSEKLSSELSPDFNLIDDGTVPGLPNSTAFDDEGVNQAKTIVIKNGVFEQLLNSSQFKEEGEMNSGNSFRVKMFEYFPRNYQAYPSIYPSNLLIGEGETLSETIIEEIGDGIFVNSTHGYMTADYHSGAFKVSANDAYKIEKGEIVGTLDTFDIIGNIFEVLSKNPLFSKDRKVVRPNNTPYSIVSPCVVSEEISIFL
ncbi:MAG: TldD/PmbA family protein [Candidatus Heimdallarchaeota archaeon]|nr:TldD/PmbA family protein [Candidatus Heimdallarchaeota archaeon]